MESLENYYNTIIDEITNKAVEVFNNSYNLDIKKESIIENLVNEINNQPPINEMSELSINNKCLAIKRNKTVCSNKCIPGHVYCGTHLRSEAKLQLPEHIKMVTDKYKYEIVANTVSLGNEWMIQNKLQTDHNINTKWPLEIKNNSNSLNSFILFFSEFPSYFGAGVFIIQYISTDKKESYFMATHYVEINKFADDLQSNLYAKISFKSISSLKEKPIFNKIKSFLEEYGIPYDISDINKRNNVTSENNPVVIYNNINKIISSHYNLMYFAYDSYINSNIDKE